MFTLSILITYLTDYIFFKQKILSKSEIRCLFCPSPVLPVLLHHLKQFSPFCIPSYFPPTYLKSFAFDASGGKSSSFPLKKPQLFSISVADYTAFMDFLRTPEEQLSFVFSNESTKHLVQINKKFLGHCQEVAPVSSYTDCLRWWLYKAVGTEQFQP